jgi:hypothetical protein
MIKFLVILFLPFAAFALEKGKTYSDLDNATEQKLVRHGNTPHMSNVIGLMEVITNPESMSSRDDALSNLLEFAHDGFFSPKTQNRILDGLLKSEAPQNSYNLLFILQKFAGAPLMSQEVLSKLEALSKRLDQPKIDQRLFLWAALPLIQHYSPGLEFIKGLTNKVAEIAQSRGNQTVRMLAATLLLNTYKSRGSLESRGQVDLGIQVVRRLMDETPELVFEFIMLIGQGACPLNMGTSELVADVFKGLREDGMRRAQRAFLRIKKTSPPRVYQDFICRMGLTLDSNP